VSVPAALTLAVSVPVCAMPAALTLAVSVPVCAMPVTGIRDTHRWLAMLTTEHTVTMEWLPSIIVSIANRCASELRDSRVVSYANE